MTSVVGASGPALLLLSSAFVHVDLDCEEDETKHLTCKHHSRLQVGVRKVVTSAGDARVLRRLLQVEILCDECVGSTSCQHASHNAV